VAMISLLHRPQDLTYTRKVTSVVGAILFVLGEAEIETQKGNTTFLPTKSDLVLVSLLASRILPGIKQRRRQYA
jgi:hypothetical protein